MRSMPKTKLSFLDLLDRVWSVIKTIQDNDMTNHISLVYIETKIELLRPIELSVGCYKNEIGQRHD